jgi:putative tricarboxylic transport membrane protein
LIERAGFIVAASVTFFGITVAFGNKRHGRSAIFGTLFITLVYLSFTKFLNVPLPAGIFKGLL